MFIFYIKSITLSWIFTKSFEKSFGRFQSFGMFSNLSYQYYDIPAKLAQQRENQMGNRMTPKHILITILCIRLNKRCVIHMFTMCFVGKGESEKVFRLIKDLKSKQKHQLL